MTCYKCGVELTADDNLNRRICRPCDHRDVIWFNSSDQDDRAQSTHLPAQPPVVSGCSGCVHEHTMACECCVRNPSRVDNYSTKAGVQDFGAFDHG